MRDCMQVTDYKNVMYKENSGLNTVIALINCQAFAWVQHMFERSRSILGPFLHSSNALEVILRGNQGVEKKSASRHLKGCVH